MKREAGRAYNGGNGEQKKAIYSSHTEPASGPPIFFSKLAKRISLDIRPNTVLVLGPHSLQLATVLRDASIKAYARDLADLDATTEHFDLVVITTVVGRIAYDALRCLRPKPALVLLSVVDGGTDDGGIVPETLMHCLSELIGFAPKDCYDPGLDLASVILLERREEPTDEKELLAAARLVDLRMRVAAQIEALKNLFDHRMKRLTEDHDRQIRQMQDELSHALEMKTQVSTALETMQLSTSWRVTAPYRAFGSQIANLMRAFYTINNIAEHRGGYRRLAAAAVGILSRDGPNGVVNAWRSVRTSLGHRGAASSDYSKWLETYAILDDKARQTIRSKIGQWQNPPLISIIMPVYNPKISWLVEAIESVRKQLYFNWELCIAEDGSTTDGVKALLESYSVHDERIKVTYRPVNGHISEASNSALALATGEWMTLLDQDDLLTEDALYHVSRTLIANPDLDLVYSDEDKIEDGRRFDPYFKPDWNVELLRSHNMVCHLSTFRIERVRAIGAFRRGFEGSQDYDLVLRFSEGLSADRIGHIPRVLYHWRVHSNSTAQGSGNKSYAAVAGRKALAEHLERLGIDATVETLETGMYRTRYGLPQQLPLASLIIPTRNGLDLVRQCVTSILQATSYAAYEIIIIDNNSDDPATLAYFRDIATNPRVRVERDERPFNYSALNNRAVEMSNGDYIVLINNDIEVISPDWLSEMMSLAMQDGVGAVGARLWYPDDTLQHGGVIIGLGGVAGHSHKQLKRGLPGYFRRAELPQDLSAVTAACLVIRKSIFEEVGGLNEVDLKIAFNDVDFCLKVKEAGYRNVWTPYADLYHHESATRGLDDTPEKVERFRQEIAYMHARWETYRRPDPAYSPNLTLNYEDFSLAWPPRNDEGPTLAS
ncbi:glycosyltransferase family 2 protein [Rhizobium rhododendri]|uniref:Glycosyltransferase family 2 protein n=1 Tax=Rhizobium rhododendri TaxID=2506430 RepID=A0ABY8IPM3_9HYPH|nr:glycosyltransferase family 2 protein [Rhizobium rhododendri]WFS25132.1 glycosyltransferase family 2 protein [Rhizobium rhododendri]